LFSCDNMPKKSGKKNARVPSCKLQRSKPAEVASHRRTDHRRIDRALRNCKADVTTELLDRFQAQLDAFKADVTTELHGLKSDVHALKADVHVLKADAYAFNSDVHVLKANVRAFKSDVKTMVAGVSAMLPLPLHKIGNYLDSVVRVQTCDGGFGTGFVVGNAQRYVLTARRVVTQTSFDGEFLLDGHVHLPKQAAPVKYTAAWLHVDSTVDIALLEFRKKLDRSQLPVAARAPPLGTKVFNLTTDAEPGLPVAAEAKILNFLFSTLELSGHTHTLRGRDALLVTGPGRTGHSGSPVGRDGGVFGIVVESAGPRRKRASGEELEEALANATSQRGVVLRLFPYLWQRKWFKVDLDTATSHAAIQLTHTKKTKIRGAAQTDDDADR
jgi:hypothetical protein